MTAWGLHRRAKEWAANDLDLVERPGDDRLWDRQGRSYKVKARTGTRNRLYTSFDLPHGHEAFDYLVGVVFDPDGDVIRAFQVDQATFRGLARVNEDSVRLRLSDRGPGVYAVEWLVGAPDGPTMKGADPSVPTYLPKRIRRCPECGDRDRVQTIVWGLPTLPIELTPEEEGRVLFGGCVVPSSADPEQVPPEWHCPTCDVSYTARGVIVPES